MLNGTVIKDQWRLLSKIGEGAFGEIYMTKNILTNEIAAIKLERADAKKQVLKLEVAVLKKLQSCPNVCRLLACGRHHEWNYMVMDLLGENLGELRRNAGGKFDMHTSVRLAYQFVSILEEIHNLGHIHRDIKPSNFAVGLQGENRRKIYLIDWGLARRYTGSDGSTVRPQRESTGFRGTARYASINSHAGKDLSRRDDLWSVFYILVEFAKGALPWRRLKDKDKIGEMKVELNNTELVRGLPPVFTIFMEYLQTLTYEDRPDYTYIKQILSDAVDKLGGNTAYPWETASSPSLSRSAVSQLSSNVGLVSSEDSMEAGSGMSSGDGKAKGAGSISVGGGVSTHSHSIPESTGSSSRGISISGGIGSGGNSNLPPLAQQTPGAQNLLSSPQQQQKFILLRKGETTGVAVVKPAKTLIGTPYLATRTPSNTSITSPFTSTNFPPLLPDDEEGEIEEKVDAEERDGEERGDVELEISSLAEGRDTSKRIKPRRKVDIEKEKTEEKIEEKEPPKSRKQTGSQEDRGKKQRKRRRRKKRNGTATTATATKTKTNSSSEEDVVSPSDRGCYSQSCINCSIL